MRQCVFNEFNCQMRYFLHVIISFVLVSCVKDNNACAYFCCDQQVEQTFDCESLEQCSFCDGKGFTYLPHWNKMFLQFYCEKCHGEGKLLK